MLIYRTEGQVHTLLLQDALDLPVAKMGVFFFYFFNDLFLFRDKFRYPGVGLFVVFWP